jgi:hypothetical protein
MIALVFIILALAFAPPLKEFVDNARNSSSDTQVGLDCGNSSISSFDKASCMFVDSYTPYFIGFLVFAGGAIMVAKIIG